jgi:hypothetical protein
VEHISLLECRAQRAMQAVLEVQLLVPPHDVREQVAVERGVLGEQGGEIEVSLGRDQVIQPYLLGRQPRPVLGPQPMVGVRAGVANSPENHWPSLVVHWITSAATPDS